MIVRTLARQLKLNISFIVRHYLEYVLCYFFCFRKKIKKLCLDIQTIIIIQVKPLRPHPHGCLFIFLMLAISTILSQNEKELK